MGKQWKQWQTLFSWAPITADSDCSHEIKRHLLLGRKTVTNLDSILKSRDMTLPTKVHLVKAVVFPLVMYGCKSWTTKKADHWKIDTFKLWCWRRLLRVPWTARRCNESILKEINPEYSLEGLMLELQYFGYMMWKSWLIGKTLMLGKIEGRRRWGWQRMRWLNGIIDSVDMSLRKLWEIVKGRETWSAAAEWLNSWLLIHICSLYLFIGPLLLVKGRHGGERKYRCWLSHFIEIKAKEMDEVEIIIIIQS